MNNELSFPLSRSRSPTKFKMVLAAEAKQAASEIGSVGRSMRAKNSKAKGLQHTNSFLSGSRRARHN
jgi:hypothetical protein